MLWWFSNLQYFTSLPSRFKCVNEAFSKKVMCYSNPLAASSQHRHFQTPIYHRRVSIYTFYQNTGKGQILKTMASDAPRVFIKHLMNTVTVSQMQVELKRMGAEQGLEHIQLVRRGQILTTSTCLCFVTYDCLDNCHKAVLALDGKPCVYSRCNLMAQLAEPRTKSKAPGATVKAVPSKSPFLSQPPPPPPPPIGKASPVRVPWHTAPTQPKCPAVPVEAPLIDDGYGVLQEEEKNEEWEEELLDVAVDAFFGYLANSATATKLLEPQQAPTSPAEEPGPIEVKVEQPSSPGFVGTVPAFYAKEGESSDHDHEVQEPSARKQRFPKSDNERQRASKPSKYKKKEKKKKKKTKKYRNSRCRHHQCCRKGRCNCKCGDTPSSTSSSTSRSSPSARKKRR